MDAGHRIVNDGPFAALDGELAATAEGAGSAFRGFPAVRLQNGLVQDHVVQGGKLGGQVFGTFQ